MSEPPYRGSPVHDECDDPPTPRDMYEGDIKGAILEELLESKEELGLTSLDEISIRDIIDRTVTRQIGELIDWKRMT